MPNTNLVDQRTDKSGAAFIKIASRMTDQGLAKMATETLFGMERPMAKEAEFPCNTAKDTLVSRIYFEGQREKIASDLADEIDLRLSVREELYGLPHKISFREQEKVAAEEVVEVELLPSVKIASEEDLVQSGKDFCDSYEKLCGKDRVKFASGFAKIAGEAGIDIPDTVKLYAGVDVAPRSDIADNVLLRKVAMERMGADASGYAALHEQLVGCDTSSFPMKDLRKMAEFINMADEAYGLRDSRHGKTIPDAWHSVFQVKHAEDADTIANAKAEGMSKADIVARYGEGILEEIEDAEGNIDHVRLSEVLRALGDDKEDTTKEKLDSTEPKQFQG